MKSIQKYIDTSDCVKERASPSVATLVKDKYLLTVAEASEYFGLSQFKIRQKALDDSNHAYSLRNGRCLLIKRRAFEEYLENASEI